MVSTFKGNTPVPNETGPQRWQRIKLEMHAQLLETIDLRRLERVSPDDLRQEMATLVRELVRSSGQQLSEPERDRLVEEILADIFGLGPIDPFMKDPDVSEIVVNGPGRVYVERLGRLEKKDVVFRDDEHLMQIIQRLAARMGRRVDERSPQLVARLPDGSHVHIVAPPVAMEGAVLSIRPRGPILDSQAMLANNTLAPEMLTLLNSAVDGRLGILITGGTGSGKTSLLNMLCRYIPVTELLAIVEEMAELKPVQQHLIRFEARPTGAGEAARITQRDLIQACVQLRADRLVLGEASGPEVLDLLLAMKGGQDGSLTTIHANDPHHALHRLETMALMAGSALPHAVVVQHISSAFTLIVHVGNLKGGARRVMRISEIVRGRVRDIFRFQETGIENGAAVGEFQATGYQPRCVKKLAAIGVNLAADMFEKRVLLTVKGAPPAPAAEVAQPADPFLDPNSTQAPGFGGLS